MRYRATHSTRYRYDAAVSQCQSEVRLTPRALPWQSLIESRIEVTPDAAEEWQDREERKGVNDQSRGRVERDRRDRIGAPNAAAFEETHLERG